MSPAATPTNPAATIGTTSASTTAHRSATERRQDRIMPRAVLIAGITHPLAWIAGLAVWPTNLDVRSDDAAVLATYSGSSVPAAVQAALVHGLAGVALAVVTVGLAGLTAVPSARRVVLWSGLGAACTSLVQLAVDLGLALHVAPSGDAGSAGATLRIIDHLDGAKMLLLAALALGTLQAARRRSVRWLALASAALAATIAVSGIGYLFLVSPLASVAFVSGPLLLVWMPTVAVTVWRAARHTVA